MPGIDPLVGEVQLLIKPAMAALNKLRALIQGVNQDFAKIGAGAQVQSSLKDIPQTGGRAQQVLKTVAQTLDQAAKSSTGLATGMRRVSEAVAQVRVPDIGGALQKQVNQAKDALKQNTREIRQSIVGVQQEITATEKLLDAARAQRIQTTNETIRRQTAARDVALSISREIHQAEIELDRQRQGRLAAVNRSIEQSQIQSLARTQANAKIAAQNLQRIFSFRPTVPGGALLNFGNIQQLVTGPVAQLNKAITQAATAAQKVKIPPPPTPQYQQFGGVLGGIVSDFKRIATFSIAAGLIVRGFFEILSAIKNTVAEGLRFNAVLEEGQLALAGILGSTREVQDAQGKTVELARAFPFLLGEAAKRQKEILLANIETLGTGEELLAVYNQVLASTRGQKEQEGDVLKASQVILNIMKLRGFAGERIVEEARQFFTAEKAIGQTVAQTLGIRFQEQKALRDSGNLLQAGIRKGEIFLQLGKNLANTWTGLISTISTFFSFIAGEAFSNTFLGVKEIFQGMIDALQAADAQGGIAAILNVSPAELRALGVALGEFTISFVTGLADMTNRIIEWGAATHRILPQIKQDFLDASQGVPFSGQGRAPTVPSIPAAPIGGTEEDIQALRIIASLLGEVNNGIIITKNFFSSLWAQLKEQFAGPSNPINEWVAGVLVNFSSLWTQLKEQFVSSGNPINEWVAGVLVNFSSLWAQLKEQFVSSGNPINEWVAGVLVNFSSLWTQLKEQFVSSGNLINEWVAGILAQGKLLASRFPTFLKEAFAPPDIEPQSKMIGALVGGLATVQRSANDTAVTIKDVFKAPVGLQVLLGASVEIGKNLGDAGKEIFTNWKIVNETLEPTPAQLEKINQQNLQVAQSAKRAADAQARFAEAIAETTGDVQGFLDARMAAIARETAVEVARATKQGTLDRELTFIQIENQVKRQEAVTKSTEIIAAQEKKITDIVNKQLDLQAEAARGQLSARGTSITAEIANLELRLQLAQEYSGTIAEQIDLTRKLGEAQVAQAQNALDLAQQELTALQAKIDALKEEVRVHLSLMVARTVANNAIGASQEADLVRAAVDALKVELNKLPEAQAKIQAAIAGIGRATIGAANDLNKISTVTIRWGDVIRNSLKQVFDAMVAGTLKVKDAFRSLGLAIVGEITDAFAKVIANKLGFDSIIKQNVGGIGGIFKSLGGSILKSLGGALKAVGVDVALLKGGLSSLWTELGSWLSGGASNIRGSIGTIFEGLGSFLAGALGFGLAEGVKKIFGFGGSFEADIGGKVGGLVGGIIGNIIGNILLPGIGGPIGSFIGSFIGDLLGSLLGGLFAHIPTKGTQIRKGVVEWLKDLGVTFADEIKSGKYFFEETKALAAAMFGDDFLAASKQILTEKAGPELAKQLQALGTFITADVAMKLGKSVEQTGTTFGNMLIANLGIEKIPEAIEEIIEKAGIKFPDLIGKLIEVFNAGVISVDFFKDAVEGAILIFFKDFPAAAEVARQSFDKAFADGKISAKEFEETLLQAMTHVKTIVEAAADAMSRGIEEGLSSEDATRLFLDNLKKAMRGAAIAEFMKDFFGDFFKDINLVDAALSDEDIQKLATRFKIGFEKLKEILRAAGLLDDELKDWQSRIKATMSEAFSQGIEAGMSAVDAADNFEQLLKRAVRAEAIKRFVKEFFDNLFAEGDMSRALLTKEDIDAMVARFKIKYGELWDWLKEKKLLPDEEIEGWIGKLKAALEAIPATVGSSLTTAIVEALEKADFKVENVDLGTLQRQMEDIVARAVMAAVVGALVEAFVVAPMMAALAPFVAGLTGGAAAAGATVAAGGVTAGAALVAGGAAGAAMLAAATAGLKLLWDLMQTPEFAEFLAFAKEKFAPGAGVGVGAGAGAAGGGGQTFEQTLQDAAAKFLEAANRFTEGVNASLPDPVGDLVSKMQEALDQLPNFLPKSFAGALESLKKLDEIFKGEGSFGILVRDLLTAVQAMGQALVDGVTGMVRDFETGGKQQENPLKKVIDEFTVLFQGIQKNAALLTAAGTDVDALLARLTTALSKRLAEAIADLIGQFDDLIPASENLADQLTDIREQFGDAIQTLRDALAALPPESPLTKQIQDMIDLLLGALPKAIKAAAERFLEPMRDFIARGQPEVSRIQALSDEHAKLRQKVIDNAVALAEAGIDVNDVLTKLSDSLRQQLIQALEDMTRDFIAKGQPQADAIQSILNEYNKIREGILAHADILRAAGVDVDKVLGDLSDSLKNQLVAAIKEMTSGFIERGLGAPGAIASLFKEFSGLQQQILDHADVLRAAGVDVDEVLKKLTDSLVSQFAKMRTELLEPITAAIERLAPADLRDLADILGEIAGAGTLEDLARIRDAAIANIEERLRREEEAARKATEENIKLINLQKDEELERLREIQAVEEERMRSQMTQMDRLVSLREQQLNEEISAIDEALRGVEDLRTSAQDLRKTAADFLLSTESPFTPRQRFFEAQRQFAESVTPDTFRALVEETRNVFASSEEGQRIIDAALAQLLIMADTLEGQASEQEQQLQAQKKSLTALLGIEDTAVEIARLTKELGLTGTESLDELRTLRGKLDEQLEGIRKTFEQETKNLAAIFDAAIAREQAALEAKLLELKEAAVNELTTLRTALSDKFDELIAAVREQEGRPRPGSDPSAGSALAILRQGLQIFASLGNVFIAKPAIESLFQQFAGQIRTAGETLNLAGLTKTLAAKISFETLSAMTGVPSEDWRRNAIALVTEVLRQIVPLQHGGIVTRPTLALLGEKGPERVTPLSPYNSPRAFPSDSLKTDSPDVVNEVRELRADLKKLQEVMAQQSDRPIQVQVTSVLDGRAIGRSIQTGLKQGDIVVPRDALSTRVF